MIIAFVFISVPPIMTTELRAALFLLFYHCDVDSSCYSASVHEDKEKRTAQEPDCLVSYHAMSVVRLSATSFIAEAVHYFP